MIRKRGDKFVVTNKAGTKVLGTHSSESKAKKQLAAIEISKAKHMKENKTFKAFRSTLTESEYSEVLTGYGNRSAHKDDAGLHHLQSAGALAGINAMLATIGKGTYLDPNEAFLKMKVRLNVVQLDFDWKPRSWDGGVGSYDIPVVQFGRVDGYDALTGQIRFDGKANPTGGYTQLNLHVDVELTPESLYVVTAKLTPAAPVAEGVEVAEDLQTPARAKEMRQKYKDAWLQGDTAARKVKAKDTEEKTSKTHIYSKGGIKSKLLKPVKEDIQTPAREREMKRKIDKADASAQRAYETRMTKTGTVASRASKQEDKQERKLVRLLKRDTKEFESPYLYGRGGKIVKRKGKPVREETEQIEEKVAVAPAKPKTKDTYASSPNAWAKWKGERYGKAKPAVKEEVEQIDEVSPPGMEKMTGSKHAKASFAKQYGKRGKEVMYATAWKQYNKKKAMKEETEQIDEAGAAKLARMGYAYDRARIGSRGVNNPERKQQMRDAYYKQREKVEASKAKRVAAGTFDKERELQAHHKRLDVIAAKRAAGKAGKDQVRVAESRRPMGKKIAKPKINQEFGAASMSEELVGGQKKLDVNKNKRLDAQDFALLRAKKKPMQEAKIKKSILTQKVQDGKKVGSPRPIAKYEG